jgi:hypothetical protein
MCPALAFATSGASVPLPAVAEKLYFPASG